MNTWNYRLINRTHRNGGEPWVEIVEVYYDENGKLEGFSNPFINGETKEEVLFNLKRIIADIEDNPVLELAEFGRKPEDDVEYLNSEK